MKRNEPIFYTVSTLFTAFIRRSKCTGFCSSQLDDFSSLCDAADTRLFTEILHKPYHVLQALLTPPADHNYKLRDRPHNRHVTSY